MVEILTMDSFDDDDDDSSICEGDDDSLMRNHELFQHSYEQASHLLKDFDRTTVEWLFELKNELQIMPIVGQLSNMSIFEETNVFLNLLDSVSASCVDHSMEIESEQRAVDDGDVFASDKDIDYEGSEVNSENDSNSQRQQGFSQYFLDVMDNVNQAKDRLANRFNKMKQSFNHLKDVQKSTVERSIVKFKRDTGFDKLEQQLEESDYQLLKFQTMLKERRRQVDEHKKAHRDLTIQEIRAKFEGELQEKIKQLILQVERKTNELHDLEVSHGILKQGIDKLNIDLSVLLHDVEAEERRNFVDRKQAALSVAAATTSSELPSSACMEDEGNSNSSSSSTDNSSGGSVPSKFRDVHAILFNTDSNGIITEEHLSDSKSVLSQVTDEQARLGELIAVMEERNMKLTRKLRELPRSDESRGIDRLKKRIVELESNLKANEGRYKLMSKLHFRMKDDQRSQHKQSSSIEEGDKSDPGKAKNSKPLSVKVAPAKQRTIRSKYLDQTNPEELHSRVKELLGLLKSSGETLSDIAHRHVYAAYFVDDAAGTARDKKMDFAKDALRSVTVGYPAVDGMPKKRRITKKDSSKIKAIADRIALHRSRYLSRNQTASSHAIIEYPPGGMMITIAPRGGDTSRSDLPSKEKAIDRGRIVTAPLPHSTGSNQSKSALRDTSAIEEENDEDEGPISTTAPHETDESNNNNSNNNNNPPKKKTTSLSEGRSEYPNVPPSNISPSRTSFSQFWNDFDDGIDALHQTATAAASQHDADDEETEKPESIADHQTAASMILRSNRVKPRSVRQTVARPTRGSSDVDFNDRQQFNEASISAAGEEDDSDREFYSQNYGIYSALEQAQAMLKELTTVKVDKGLDFVKDIDDDDDAMPTSKQPVGSAARDTNNRHQNIEYKSVESLQQSSELYVKKISEVHFKSKHIDTIRKTLKIKLQNVMKAEIKARIRLCGEIEGSNWSIATLPGLYQADIEDCKARIEQLKELCKNAEHGLSVKRRETRRISQAFIQRTSFAGLKVPPLLPPRPTVHRDRAITTIEDDAAEDDDTAYTDSVNTESSSDSNHEYGDEVGVGDDVMRNNVIPNYLFVDYDADDSGGDD